MLGQEAHPVIPELCHVVQSGAEQGENMVIVDMCIDDVAEGMDM
jgi:hypothetical protein